MRYVDVWGPQLFGVLTGGGLLLAQAPPPADVGRLATYIVIVAALVAVAFVAVKAMKYEIPRWVVAILVILGIAALAIVAIRFLLSLGW